MLLEVIFIRNETEINYGIEAFKDRLQICWHLDPNLLIEDPDLSLEKYCPQLVRRVVHEDLG